MSKYNRATTVTDISDVNQELAKIETAIDSHLDREGSTPNQMEADLDMNSNDILNAGSIGADSVSVGGVSILDESLAVSTLPDQTGQDGKYLSTSGGAALWAEVSNFGVINIDDYISNDAAASSGINTAATLARSTGQALVSFNSSKTYTLDAQVDLRGIKHLWFYCSFDTTPIDGTAVASTVQRNGYDSYWDNYCMIIGGFSGTTGGSVIFRGDFLSSNVASSGEEPTVRPQLSVHGWKSAYWELGNIQYLRFYQEEDGGPPQQYNSCAYNEIHLKQRIAKFEVTGDYRAGYASGIPNNSNYVLWWNENKIRGGRIIRLYLRDRGYGHNHNKFFDNNFEGNKTEVRIEAGSNNIIEGARFEAARSTYSISAVTQANPVNITTEDEHNFNVGDDIYINGFTSTTGMSEFTEGWYTIGTVVDDNNVTISGVDSSAWSAYINPATSGANSTIRKPQLWFGTDTIMNHVERSWASSIVPQYFHQTPFIYGGVYDDGVGNTYSYKQGDSKRRHTVFQFSGEQTLLASGTTPAVNTSDGLSTSGPLRWEDGRGVGFSRGFYPSVISSAFPNSFSLLGQTGLLPVKVGDTFTMWCKARAGGCRLFLHTYAADGTPLSTPAANQDGTLNPYDDDLYISSTSLTYDSTPGRDGLWYTQSDVEETYNNSTGYVPSASFSIQNSAIKFIRIAISTGSSVATSQIDYCSVYYHEPNQGNPDLVARLETEYSDPYLEAKPTMGVAKLGQKVNTPDGTYECVKSIYTRHTGTTQTQGSPAALTISPVETPSPFNGEPVVGDIVGVVMSDGSMHWDTVGAYSSPTITTTNNLSSNAGNVAANVPQDSIVWVGKWEKVEDRPGDVTESSGNNPQLQDLRDGHHLRCTYSIGAITCDLPDETGVVDPAPVGTVLYVEQASTQVVTLSNSATDSHVGTSATTAQYDVLMLRKVDATTWLSKLL